MIEPIEIYPQPDPCCDRACPETKPNYAAEAEAAANEAAAASVIAKEWAEKAEETYELFTDYAYSKEETYNRNEVNDLLADKADITELNNYYDKTETDTLLAAKADASDLDDYYDKTETDTLLAAKADASDLDDYYDKTETDTLLAAKADASDLDDYYDKTETDTLLADKANISALENYYTKSNVDDKIANIIDGGILAANGTKTYTYSSGCLVIMWRASQSTTPTVALVDNWQGIVYLANNTNFRVTASGFNLTLTNGGSGYINYAIINLE